GGSLELIQALERQIRAFQPHVIYTHWWGDVNADHARIAEAVDVAARPYSAPGLQSIYAFETPSSTEWTASGRAGAFAPNVFVDISDELDRKLDAMRCYESELRPPPHPRSLRSLEQRAAYWGSVANMPAAEALALLRTRRQRWERSRAHRPDIVHAFDTKPAILAPLAARDAAVPGTVATITGLGYLFSSRSPLALSLRPVFRFLQRRAAAATGVTIFQNPDDRAYFRRHRLVRPGRDALVLGSGIDFTPLQVDGAAVGRLRRELSLEGRLVV